METGWFICYSFFTMHNDLLCNEIFQRASVPFLRSLAATNTNAASDNNTALTAIIIEKLFSPLSEMAQRVSMRWEEHTAPAIASVLPTKILRQNGKLSPDSPS